MTTPQGKPHEDKYLPEGEDSIPQDPNTDNSWQMEPLEDAPDKPEDDKG